MSKALTSSCILSLCDPCMLFIIMVLMADLCIDGDKFTGIFSEMSSSLISVYNASVLIFVNKSYRKVPQFLAHFISKVDLYEEPEQRILLLWGRVLYIMGQGAVHYVAGCCILWGRVLYIMGQGAVYYGAGCCILWGRVLYIMGQGAVYYGAGCCILWGRVLYIMGQGAVYYGAGCCILWGRVLYICSCT